MFAIALLLSSAMPLSFEDDTEVVRPSRSEWVWTKKEESRIRKMMRSVELGGDDKYRLSQTSWHVATFGSARLAAEIGVYMELFEAAVLERMGLKRNHSVEPEVVVLDTYAEFQKKAPLSSGAGLVYEAVDDGKGKNRTRILDNQLYTVIEDNDDPQFSDLKLSAIHTQAAKAILIGVFGRPHISMWYQEGVEAYFADWDLHENPKKDALLNRRERSEGVAQLRLFRSKKGDWLPPIAKLISKSPDGYRAMSLDGDVPNEIWSESVIDLLLTEKRAKSLKEDINEEILRVGLSGKGTALTDIKTADAVAKLWERHVHRTLAPVE